MASRQWWGVLVDDGLGGALRIVRGGGLGGREKSLPDRPGPVMLAGAIVSFWRASGVTSPHILPW
jgi:hypothetical protein